MILMTRLIAAMVMIVFLAQTARAGTEYWSYAVNKIYVVTVTRGALKKSPTWTPDAENSPLSAGRAIKLANEMKDSLVKDSNGYKWKLRDVSLSPDDYEGGKWFWVISYEASFHKEGFIVYSSGTQPFLRLVVLMDGTVIKPTRRIK
jgi:hypothetical protein